MVKSGYKDKVGKIMQKYLRKIDSNVTDLQVRSFLLSKNLPLLESLERGGSLRMTLVVPPMNADTPVICIRKARPH